MNCFHPFAFAIVFLLAVASAAAQGAVLYVSPGGNDSADGSRERPLRTIARAASLARAGTTVHLLPGVYYEQLVTRASGGVNNPIVYTGQSQDEVILDGSRLRAESDSGREQNRGVVELRHPWTVLRNVTIRNSPYSGVVLGASNLVVERSRVTEIRRHAISTDTRHQTANRAAMIQNITIRGNLVTRSVQRGLGYGQAISLIADGFKVEGNTVRNNHTEGIDIWLGARNGVVAYNNVHHNMRTGIYIDGASNVNVWGNRVYANGVWTDGTTPGVSHGHGIGVASENVNYPTRDIYVLNNLSYLNRKVGIFVWDDSSRAGHRGSQNVLIAYNTVVDNAQIPFYLVDGVGNTGEVVDNLFQGSSPRSGDMEVHANVRLSDLTSFVNAPAGDFRLRSSSPAIGRAVPFRSWAFGAIAVATDFSGLGRVAPLDAGAFEYR